MPAAPFIEEPRMSRLAIIGGTGLTHLPHLDIEGRETVTTPFGAPSSDLIYGRLHGRELVFLARHGHPHAIPPHKINYRANVWALAEAKVSGILAVAAVGGITAAMAPGRVAVPDQIIDYTFGRAHTFFEEELQAVTHVDFSYPYSSRLRSGILAAATAAGIAAVDGGVYGCTQGPRLESAAEIARMERDGCDLVGMTGMPEAGLARELELDYACCAVVANWAAGKVEGEITMAEIESNLARGMGEVMALLQAWASA
jgi:5'-methylthioadenosine phosphorylase/5'-methylthioinosine phosphorylase